MIDKPPRPDSLWDFSDFSKRTHSLFYENDGTQQNLAGALVFRLAVYGPESPADVKELGQWPAFFYHSNDS